MELKDKIRVIEDFPKEGISFKDVTTLTKDPEAFKATVDALAERCPKDFDLVIGPESRGFLFGTALAYKLGKGFEPVRKPGKLPAETVEYSYDLEYGSDTLQIHKDAIAPGDRVVIVDDLLATGGTLDACCKLVEKLGGEVAAVLAVIELTGLNGRELLKDYKVEALVDYEF